MALPKKIWKISRFHKGVSNLNHEGEFWFSNGLEFDFHAPFLRVANKFFKETDSDTITTLDAVYWATIFDSREYIINELDGKIFRNDYGSWAEVHDNAYAWGGLGLFGDDDYLYYASNSYAGRYDKSTWTDNWQSFATSNSANLCPIIKFLKFICFGNRRYLAVWDTANTVWDNDRIILPPGYDIKWLAPLTDYLVISAHHANFGSALFFWDGVSQTYNRVLQLPKVQSIAGAVDKNTLYLITRDGWISRFDGVGLVKLKRFPDMELEDYISINPDAVKVYQGLIYIAKTSNTYSLERRWQYCGIWVFNPVTNALYFKHQVSSHAVHNTTGGVISIGTLFLNSSGNTIRTVWYDGNKYIIDVSNETGSFRPYKWGAYWISPILDDEPYRRKRFIQMILNFWKPLPDNSFARFEIKYNTSGQQMKDIKYVTDGSSKTFTVSYGASAWEIGDEVTIISGPSAGQIRHIEKIEGNTVTVDETLYYEDGISGSYRAGDYVMITPFKKLGSIKGNENPGKLNKMLRFNTRSKKIQLKIEVWSQSGYVGEWNLGLVDISTVYVPDRIIK